MNCLNYTTKKQKKAKTN